MRIPVANLFYLLCYAWNHLDEAEVIEASIAGATTMPELVSRVLVSGCDHLFKRGMDRGYTAIEEEYAGIRGKLEIGRTVATAALTRGRTVCIHDEITHDILPNQILRTTVAHLLTVYTLPVGLRDDLAAIDRRLRSVSRVRLSPRVFNSVQIHRNNRVYDFLLKVCRLAYDGLLPDQKAGTMRFRDFTRNRAKMAMLFQQFVFNFLAREQKEYDVGSPQISWLELAATEADRRLLPRMQTDVVLASPKRALIIDTKYYREAFQTNRFGKQTVRSAHIYQMLSYLRNYEPPAGAACQVNGLLLYPQVSSAFDMRFRFGKFTLRVASLNLDQEWQQIHDRLLEFALEALPDGDLV